MTVQSSIPAATDYLLDRAAQAITAAGTDTILTDGWPSSLGVSMFGIGADRPPLEPSGQQASGTDALLTLGQPLMQERYSIPGYIYDATGGTSQKACRDAVFAIWDEFVTRLRADLNAGTIPVLVMNVESITLEGPKSVEEADSGRYALLTFSIACNFVF
jgi:hypothetical protein